MTESGERKPSDITLRALWRNWAIGFGAIIVPVIAALFVPKIWIAFICLTEAWLLISLMRTDIASGISGCSLLVYLSSRVMLIASVAMFVVVILCTDWLVPTVIHLELYNSEIPFVTGLVIFPVTALMCALSMLTGFGTASCRRCQQRNGYYAGDSIVATLYYREAKYQVGIMLFLSLALGVIDYWYYFARYINANMNEPDRFFFNYLPAAMYVVSLFFMGGRYANLRGVYDELAATKNSHNNSTVVRYLIFSGNNLLLKQSEDGRWDTPAEKVVERTPAIGEKQSRNQLEEVIGTQDFELRYCFTNDGFAAGSNVIHYAAFVDASKHAELESKGQWFTSYMVDAALAANALEPVLANELYRIHTMTMAWKTYDREGRRLYPIKHYRPTFRLGDLKDWKIDYDDHVWFDIAANNEDRLFFKTRRLWNRITGLFRSKSEVRG